MLPGAPTIGSVSAGDSAATVNWTAPASNGGSAITGYVVTPYIAGVAQAAQTFTSAATTETVTGLTPGTSYTFKVAAVNAAGTGPASAASAAVTVNAGPSLTFAAPPAGEVSIAYSDQLTASGGTGALTWSVSSGSLPPGLIAEFLDRAAVGHPDGGRQLPLHRHGHRHHRGHRQQGRHAGDRGRPVAGQPGAAVGAGRGGVQ